MKQRTRTSAITPRRLVLAGFCALMLAGTGVAQGGDLRDVSHHFRSDTLGEPGRTYTVNPQQGSRNLLFAEEGERFEIVELRNRVEASHFGISCTLNPQVFSSAEQDDDYLYYFSKTDRISQFMNDPACHNHPCGLRVAKADPADMELVCDVRKGPAASWGDTPAAIGLDSDPPILERRRMINVYKPSFRRRTLSFDSIEDGLLVLRYTEETGNEYGYGPNGELITSEPTVNESFIDVDLSTGSVVELFGGSVEIISAKPDQLSYRVIKPFPVRPTDPAATSQSEPRHSVSGEKGRGTAGGVLDLDY